MIAVADRLFGLQKFVLAGYSGRSRPEEPPVFSEVMYVDNEYFGQNKAKNLIFRTNFFGDGATVRFRDDAILSPKPAGYSLG